ncbi:NAD(P)-binding protein [Staphylococcus cohnii]|uniref:NAD(P)-binding protein n=1 Tax=Staphylococcus cohnii TaxID=29382 RepID=UPI001CCC1E74|nr:NAD(P)-binding protein [Staphylococcus cohnii]MBZ8172624.1 NAD(P)-binding protein [Staphylococcus cohnii]
MSYIPLVVDISQKQIVVIGGGKIAERRVNVLKTYTKQIQIISPTLTNSLEHLVDKQVIQWRNKTFESSDVQDADLIIAATNDTDVNQSILQAKPDRALINMAGQALAGDVFIPSILRRGKLMISVSTQGASPKLTSQILAELQQHFNSAYGDYVDFLYECRQQVKRSSLSPEEKERFLKQILNEKYLKISKQNEVRKWLSALE